VSHGVRTLGRVLLSMAALLLLAGCGGSDEGSAGEQVTTTSSSGAAALTTPDRAGDWTRVTTAAAVDNAKAYLMRAEEEARPGATPLFAEYERDDGATLAFLGFDVDPESEYGEELASSPDMVVDVQLADAGIEDRQAMDAGALGGALACGTLPPEYGVAGLTCAWADDTTTAQVTLVVPELDYDEAAHLTSEFREAVTDR
jgi:hypothetical protein